VTFAAILTLLPMLFGVSADLPRVTRLVVQDEIIIRVPVRPPPGRFQWVERNAGPKCIATGAIRAAFLSGSDHVDFMMVTRRRYRAELSEDCPALDFYEGFYLNPEDKWICANRDEIRSRMGGSCRIERFKQLVPKAGR
jgi:hypothetical protein